MSKRLTQHHPPRKRTRLSRTANVAGPRPNRFHRFLRRLSAGGRSNMYGAIPYLMQAFALDRETAFRVVCEWVDQQEAEASARAEDTSHRR